MFLTLAACSVDQDETTAESANTLSSIPKEIADTSATGPESALDNEIGMDIPTGLAEKFTETSELPVVIDSTYMISETPTSSNLTSHDVKFLSSNMAENNDIYSGEARVLDFLMIDSLRSNDLYDTYKENIDIAMILYAEANTVEQIKLDDSRKLLIWSVYYGTYEACPYASGTVFYASLMADGRLLNTAVVGETSAGGDPPVWGSTYISSTIAADKITGTKKNIDGGEDENGDDVIEEYSSNLTIDITETGLRIQDTQ